MDKNKSKNMIASRLSHLKNERREVLSLPAEEALNRILAADEPIALVHSFPAQDLHLLVHDIGMASALPVISLASNQQWEYFLDVECWHRDRMDLDAITRWAHLLLSADPNRVTQWFGSDKLEFFEHYLYKNIRVVLIEHDQDPSDLGEDFFTLDGVFYVHILDDSVLYQRKEESVKEDQDETKRKESDQKRRQLITDLLKYLADEDSIRYHQILLEAMHVVPAEIEEAAFRRRNVRLAEKGFLPFEEAIGIYQPLTIDEINHTAALNKQFRPLVEVQQPVVTAINRLADRQDPVINAFEHFDSEPNRITAQMELATLANRLIVADQKLIRDRMDLKQAVQKACGYILIGLSSVGEEVGTPDPDRVQLAALMARYSLPSLFQLGYGCALKLKWRADRWYRQSWIQGQGLTLTFLGEAWLGVLGGLLLKKPLFFDEALGDRHYREFGCMDDITHTNTVLTGMIAMDSFLDRMGVDLDQQQPAGGLLTYKNMLLTLWVRDYLKLSRKVSPIDVNLFQSFFSDWLLANPKNKSARQMATIGLDTKQSFLDWLIRESDLSATQIMERIGSSLDNLFQEIETELGQIAPKDIDSRFITLFLLK